MRRPVRIALIAAAFLIGLAALLAIAVFVTVRSDWFREQVRQRIVTEVERASGGRTEVGSFEIDWRRLSAEIRGFVLHGTEPASAPPLVRARSVSVGLKITSLLRRTFDIEFLNVDTPQVYLIVAADGSTNVPSPKIPRKPGKPAMETILDLAVRRFQITNGSFEVASKYRTPFEAKGQNLRAQLQYPLLGTPRYAGTVSVQPLDVRYGKLDPLALNVQAEVSIQKNRVEVPKLTLATRDSRVQASGVVENFADPMAKFQYTATVSAPEFARVLHIRGMEAGTVEAGGNLSYTRASDLRITGNARGKGIALNEGSVRLRDFTVESSLDANAGRIEFEGVRLAGNVTAYLKRNQPERFPVDARVAKAVLRGNDLDAQSVRASLLGGDFAGRVEIRDFDRFRVEGQISGFAVERLVALYSRQKAPWNGKVSGPMRVEGSFKNARSLNASGRFLIAGPQVGGDVDVKYSARTGVVDLGRSSLTLPNTRASVSGSLGRELQVHLESSNLDDLLPLADASSLPVKLEGGAAVFDGTVTGATEDPQVAGSVSLPRFAYAGRSFDSFTAGVAVSKAGVTIRDGVLKRGALVAQIQGGAALHEWKLEDSSTVAGTVNVKNAPAAELLTLAGRKDVPVTGTFDFSANVNGTAGAPLVTAQVHSSGGTVYQQPYETFDARLNYANDRLEAANAQAVVQGKRIGLSGEYQHARNDLQNGRLTFRITTEQMDVSKLEIAQRERPGLGGFLEARASGALDVVKGEPRIADLNADISAVRMRMDQQPLGDAHIVATTKAGVLHTHIESDFARSTIRGDGEWKLTDDNPGHLEVAFTNLDFARLRRWLSGRRGAPSAVEIAGSAEGRAVIDGPALKPELWTARMEIPKLQIGPPADSQFAAQPGEFTLHNAKPLLITMRNSVLRVENAEMTGKGTDLKLTGDVSLREKSPLSLRVDGTIDLALLRDFDRNLYAAGQVVTRASIRGPFEQPVIDGRLEMKNASLNIADFSNGLSNANGVIIFDGTHATVQTLTAETGGGSVSITGFVGYGGSETVFRLLANAREVRYRSDGLSVVADANLNLTGTSTRSMLSGTVSIQRIGFNPRSDLSSVLSKSAEPVRTPSARTGVFGGMQFDVQIETAPDISFQSALTQDIEAEASLHLRGSLANPALLGRIVITEGQINFFGTKYTINQGTISFYNPVRIDPVLNVDLETKARGVDVILTVSGPMNKLNITPRSDPPLQFSEIIALLATGRTPTSDPTLLSRSAATPTQSFAQMGATALLGQAIASPVTGRLQRFFGVTRLKIDPTLSGVENNPQARLTLEQQITPDITFTYITDVTSTNPLVVRVEWSFSRQWSVVALREENGRFGLDFLYKKRFK